MYNFTVSTYGTLSSAPELEQFWKYSFPRLAFKHDYLMRTLLAVSSLHLSYYDSETRAMHVSTALREHQSASQMAIHLLQNVTNDNGIGLFLFSILTIIFGEKSSH
jgi:hypothetical protein